MIILRHLFIAKRSVELIKISILACVALVHFDYWKSLIYGWLIFINQSAARCHQAINQFLTFGAREQFSYLNITNFRIDYQMNLLKCLFANFKAWFFQNFIFYRCLNLSTFWIPKKTNYYQNESFKIILWILQKFLFSKLYF